MVRMLAGSVYTYVVINTMDGSIKAHGAVLAANSPVFETMFSKNYKEKETSTIDISDMSVGTCKAMLNFIYVKELIVVADKYDIAHLSEACEACLCEGVGAGYVFERLKCAFIYDFQHLKSACLFYLVKMGNVFELRKDYDSFLREVDVEIIVEVSNACLDGWNTKTTMNSED